MVISAICTERCLAAPGAVSDLHLLASGTNRLIVRLDACGDCRLSKVLPLIESTLATVHELLGDRIVVVKKSSADWKARLVYQTKNPPVSRREIFKLFSRESRRLATEVTATPTEETKGPSRERRRLMTALRQLALSDDVAATISNADFAFARMRVDAHCTACGICARICPTGALAFTAPTTNSYRLIFLPSHCMDCGTCLSLCKPRALRRDETPSLAELLNSEPIVLQEESLRVCVQCGAKFATTREINLCPICDWRKQNLLVTRTSTQYDELGNFKTA